MIDTLHPAPSWISCPECAGKLHSLTVSVSYCPECRLAILAIHVLPSQAIPMITREAHILELCLQNHAMQRSLERAWRSIERLRNRIKDLRWERGIPE